MTKISEKQIEASYSWLLPLALCLCGTAVSLYLAHLHVAVHTDFNYTSFCAYSRAVNCETVAESGFSVFLRVPVAVWGIWGYLLMGVVVLGGLSHRSAGRRMWMLLYVMAAFCCLISLALLLISKLYIRSICILCMASYAINFALLALVMHFRSRRRVKLWSDLMDDLIFLWQRRAVAAPIGTFFLAAAGIMPAIYPQYWKIHQAIPAYQFQCGRTEEGDPWIGATNPVLTIVEYSDYRCFYCRKAHVLLRSLMQRFPDKLRIIHRHFPLDKECNPAVKGDYHPGACSMAAWAICADKLGAFWRMHDALFALGQGQGRVELADLAKKLEIDYGSLASCLTDAFVLEKLARDIQSGIMLGIDSTPCYVVDGTLYQGRIPREVLTNRLGPLE
jgi:uncharacterized membrane protein